MFSKSVRVLLNEREVCRLKDIRGSKFKELRSSQYSLSEEELKTLGISKDGKGSRGEGLKSPNENQNFPDLKFGDAWDKLSTDPKLSDVEQDIHNQGKTENLEDDSGVTLKYLGGKPLESKEDAIKHFNIDLEKYTIERFECKSWSVGMKVKRAGKANGFDVVQVQNYGLSLKLLKTAEEIAWKNIKYKKRKVSTSQRTKLGWGIIPLADFHSGAFVADLQRTKDYNMSIMTGYLEEIAVEVNSKGYKKVYLPLLGDFIESFTGLSHINSWKGLDKDSYGMNSLFMTHELLCKHLYSKINNLAMVDFIPGNHDRVTSNNKEDTKGEVAYALQYLFNKDYGTTIESKVWLAVGSRTLDGINYLSMHGHLGLSKKDTGKIIQDYGDSSAEYHVVLSAHFHSREVKKTFKKKVAVYEDVLVVQHDSLNYRKITVAPLFTGNLYSEQLGFSSTAGMCHLYKDLRNRLRHEDVMI